MLKTHIHYAKKIKTLVPWVKQHCLQQPRITRANGVFIYSNKHKIIDFTSGLMVVNLGHNNRYIKSGFKSYMDNGISYVPPSFSTYERDKLSDRLCNIANFNNGKVFYTNAGADANEVALFITNQYNNNKKILSFQNSFHGGSTIASSLIGGDTRNNKKLDYYNLDLYPIMKNPNIRDNGDESLLQISKLFEEYRPASIIVEGSSGSAGCILYPKYYLSKLEKICRKNNVLIICDEVMSGWGRSGELFAYQKENFNPDIITTAKGITSGYSQLGAVIVNEKLSSLYNNLPVLTGLTYSGHPLPSTIANKCLDLYLEDDCKIIRESNDKAKLIQKLSQPIIDDCDIVKEYRNNGLLGCFELIMPEKLSEINNLFLQNGIYCFMKDNLIFIAPPLIIEETDIVNTMNKIYKILVEFNN